MAVLLIPWPHPHQRTDDGRKIILVGTAHGDDGGYADQEGQREHWKRIERYLHGRSRYRATVANIRLDCQARLWKCD